MSEKTRNGEGEDRSAAGDKPAKQPKYDWEDPDVPAGDAPRMPWWPLVLSVVAWCGWLAFVAVMMVLRLQTTSV